MKTVSIDNLSECTEQEVFDFIVAHLRRQKVKSAVEGLNGARCKYRLHILGRTLQCAAGCLIPQEKYKAEYEGQTWGGLIRKFSFPKNHFEIIDEMQDIHDRTDPRLWEDAWKDLAADYKLKYSKPSE